VCLNEREIPRGDLPVEAANESDPGDDQSNDEEDWGSLSGMSIVHARYYTGETLGFPVHKPMKLDETE
jgi:hypothetical protein